MSLSSHLDSLASKHRELDRQISAMQSGLLVDTMEEVRLKKQRLRLKEEIERVRGQIETTH